MNARNSGVKKATTVAQIRFKVSINSETPFGGMSRCNAAHVHAMRTDKQLQMISQRVLQLFMSSHVDSDLDLNDSRGNSRMIGEAWVTWVMRASQKAR